MTDFQRLVLAEMKHHNETFDWGFRPENKRIQHACENLITEGRAEYRNGDRIHAGYWVRA